MPRVRTTRLRLPALAAAVSAAVLATLAVTLPAAAQTAAPSPTPRATAAPSPAPSPSATPTAVLRLTTSATQVVAGINITLTARATSAAGTPVAGERVDVLSRTGGTTSSVLIGRITTGANGVGTMVWKPRTSSEYRLRQPFGARLESDKRIVHVQPRLSGSMAPASVVTGSSAVLRGGLAPAYLGVPLKVQRRLADGTWRTVSTIGSNAQGVYSTRLPATAVGRQVYRVALSETQAYRGAVSAAVALTVLPDPVLRQGDRGASVKVLEQRLAAQKADVGAVDGVFDADLRHGLTAFQKSQGLRRTGLYDAATRTRLANPVPVRLRYPAAGRAVEVDLTKQVLYLSQAGRLQRIVDISSGNDKPYTVDGVTYRAFTPTGRFSVQRKIDGIRVSRLGELYRPAYFTGGWAIHGSPSVPTYPASHGCVRVTNSSQDRLFPLLTIGTPVNVFRS